MDKRNFIKMELNKVSYKYNLYRIRKIENTENMLIIDLKFRRVKLIDAYSNKEYILKRTAKNGLQLI